MAYDVELNPIRDRLSDLEATVALLSGSVDVLAAQLKQLRDDVHPVGEG